MRRTAVLVVVGLLYAAGLGLEAGDRQAPVLTSERGLPGITGTPQGAAILRIEEQRATTPQDLALLVESARSPQGHIQDAAIRALGRLERRDVVTDLLPYLRATRTEARRETATAIGQAMRGDALPLDPNENQVDGVQQALLAAAAQEQDGGVLGEIARTLGRLPYIQADAAARAHTFLRQVLEISSQLDRAAARAARPQASAGIELMARLHGKLQPVPDETVAVLGAIAMARTATVRSSEIELRVAALQALVSAGAVDTEVLRIALTDSFSPDLRRLAMLSLGAAGSPIVGSDRLDYIRSGLGDRHAAVRVEALRAYVRHHAKSDGCQPVMDMLLDPEEHVTLAAIDALGNCAGDENVVNRLIGEARTPPVNGSWRRESHALVSLAKRSPRHLEVPLLSHSRHQAWQVRMYAARAATAADDLPTLERLALDPDDNVREATLGALRRLKKDGSGPAFIAALSRHDYQLLRTAAREMAGLRVTPALTGALLDALARVTGERKDTSRDTRLALLERLREFGSDRNVEPVARLLRDYDERVAAEAALTLGAWTGQAHAIDPQPLPPQPLPTAAELAILTSQVAFLVMETGTTIGLRLDPVRAPLMSTRFLRLANRNYYDRLTFHRVVSNFVVQGGSPGANEYAGDGPFVRDEISHQSHARGTVGLSTRGRDTGDAQIFINLVDNPRLDFEYTVFGRVLAADLEKIDRIQEGDRIVDVRFGRSR